MFNYYGWQWHLPTWVLAGSLITQRLIWSSRPPAVLAAARCAVAPVDTPGSGGEHGHGAAPRRRRLDLAAGHPVVAWVLPLARIRPVLVVGEGQVLVGRTRKGICVPRVVEGHGARGEEAERGRGSHVDARRGGVVGGRLLGSNESAHAQDKVRLHVAVQHPQARVVGGEADVGPRLVHDCDRVQAHGVLGVEQGRVALRVEGALAHAQDVEAVAVKVPRVHLRGVLVVEDHVHHLPVLKVKGRGAELLRDALVLLARAEEVESELGVHVGAALGHEGLGEQGHARHLRRGLGRVSHLAEAHVLHSPPEPLRILRCGHDARRYERCGLGGELARPPCVEEEVDGLALVSRVGLGHGRVVARGGAPLAAAAAARGREWLEHGLRANADAHFLVSLRAVLRLVPVHAREPRIEVIVRARVLEHRLPRGEPVVDVRTRAEVLEGGSVSPRQRGVIHEGLELVDALGRGSLAAPGAHYDGMVGGGLRRGAQDDGVALPQVEQQGLNCHRLQPHAPRLDDRQLMAGDGHVDGEERACGDDAEEVRLTRLHVEVCKVRRVCLVAGRGGQVHVVRVGRVADPARPCQALAVDEEGLRVAHPVGVLAREAPLHRVPRVVPPPVHEHGRQLLVVGGEVRWVGLHLVLCPGRDDEGAKETVLHVEPYVRVPPVRARHFVRRVDHVGVALVEAHGALGHIAHPVVPLAPAHAQAMPVHSHALAHIVPLVLAVHQVDHADVHLVPLLHAHRGARELAVHHDVLPVRARGLVVLAALDLSVAVRVESARDGEDPVVLDHARSIACAV
mmetsp:Transcript_19088/g.51307  ORF Transcript_19088/g.51307 Transcript_19088/m.51307 type:complete len:794 (-) Transcript_19088:346-2727(-)